MVESRGLGRGLWLLTALSRAKSLTKPHARLGLARLPALGRAMHITKYHMAGIYKGSGMIHPIMGPAATSFTSPKQLHATLLGGIMTDAAVTHLCRRQKLQFYQC